MVITASTDTVCETRTGVMKWDTDGDEQIYESTMHNGSDTNI